MLAGGTVVGTSVGPDGPTSGVCVNGPPAGGTSGSASRVDWMRVGVAVGVLVPAGVDVTAAVHVGACVAVLVGGRVAVAATVPVVGMLAVAVRVLVGA